MSAGRLRVSPLILAVSILWIGLFLVGVWTGDRPVMAVAVGGGLLSVLLWWISS